MIQRVSPLTIVERSKSVEVDPRDCDLDAAVNISQQQAAEEAAQHDAPLMDALIRTRQDNQRGRRFMIGSVVFCTAAAQGD